MLPALALVAALLMACSAGPSPVQPATPPASMTGEIQAYADCIANSLTAVRRQGTFRGSRAAEKLIFPRCRLLEPQGMKHQAGGIDNRRCIEDYVRWYEGRFGKDYTFVPRIFAETVCAGHAPSTAPSIQDPKPG